MKIRLLPLVLCCAACATPVQGGGWMPDLGVAGDVDAGIAFDTIKPPADVLDIQTFPSDAVVADAIEDVQAEGDAPPTDDTAAQDATNPDDASGDLADISGVDGSEADDVAVVPDITGADSGPPDCGDLAKLCPTSFSYVGDGSEALVDLRGSFNAWKVGIPLLQNGNTWSLTTNLPADIDIQYKFRIVKKSGGETWLVDPSNAQTVKDSGGNLNSLLPALSCDPWVCAKPQTVCGIDAKPDAFDWRDGVMYFVFVDRFVDGDNSNNQPASGIADIANWSGGDWAGVQQRVEDGYFASLGVNVLWLTVPMDGTDALELGADGHKYTAYHGYWPRDRDKPNAHFGTMAQLQALVAAAHKKGIQIVLDYAMNHVHTSSPVWQQHKNDGWFHPLGVQGQDCTCGSGVCPWEGAAIYCWFQTYLADFDFNNAAARKASIDNVIWWMQQSGADGLRLDAIKHVEGAWLTDLRQRLLAEVEPVRQQHIWLVGETYSGDQPFLKTFVDPCTKLDGQFDFAERAKLDQTVLLRTGTMQDLVGFLDTNDGYFGPDAIMSTFVGNHDLPRAIHLAQDGPLWTDVWADGKDKAWSNQPATVAKANAYERMGVAMAVLLTNPGVPLLYYGDEVGMPGGGDPDNRRPMQWSGYNDGQKALLAQIKALGIARKLHPALRRGSRSTLWLEADGWMYQRLFDGDNVVVALNRGDNPLTATGLPTGTWQDLLGGADASGGTVQVPPRGVRVLVKK